MMSKKNATEFMLEGLSSVDPLKLTLGNVQNEVVKPKLLYNMRQEINVMKKRNMGILFSGQDICDILNAIYDTQEKDTKLRGHAKDNSNDLLGVVRLLSVYPVFELYFYTKAALVLFCELCSSGYGVFGMDSTGNLFDIKHTKFTGKTQHIRFSGQLTESVIKKIDAPWAAQLLRQFLFGERVSVSNTGPDVIRFFLQYREEAKEASLSVLGRVIDPKPLIIKMDGALEFLQGVVGGFRDEGQVDTGKGYNNIVALVLLYYSGRLFQLEDESVKTEVAKDALTILQTHVGTLVKQCDVHVFDSQNQWTKHMKNRPPEIQCNLDRFKRMNNIIARSAGHVNDYATHLTRLCIFVSIYEQKTIALEEEFTVNTPLRKHHDRDLAMLVAKEQDSLAVASAKDIMISDKEMLESLIADELKNVGTPESSQRFTAHKVARKVVNNMNSKMRIATPYLKSIDEESGLGTVVIPLIFSCYKVDDNGVEKIHPRLVRFITEMKLPTGKSIPNPAYSERAANHWFGMWAARLPLWSNAIISLTETAMNVRLYGNNQGVEGGINQEKNLTSDVKEYTSTGAQLIHRRFDDFVQGGKLVAHQYRVVESEVVKRKERAEKKSKKKVKKAESHVQWGRGTRRVKSSLIHWESKMNEALTAASGDSNLKNSTKWAMMKEYATTIDGTFMSTAVFYKWMKGERKTRLRSDWTSVIEQYYGEHVETRMENGDEDEEDLVGDDVDHGSKGK